MKVQNMQSSRGNDVPNQFIIRTETPAGKETYFQSYRSVIVLERWEANHSRKVYLDSYYWDYSRTTGKYRNQFLGESKAETQKKIDSGEYILTDLN